MSAFIMDIRVRYEIEMQCTYAVMEKLWFNCPNGKSAKLAEKEICIKIIFQQKQSCSKLLLYKCPSKCTQPCKSTSALSLSIYFTYA